MERKALRKQEAVNEQPSTALVWFRQDLRLEDNPALDAAVRSGSRLVCLYIYDEEAENEWPIGSAGRWWLYHSLKSFENDLKKSGAVFIIRRGRSSDVLRDLLRETNARALYWNRLYEPDKIRRDSLIKKELGTGGVRIFEFNGSLLFDPKDIKTKQGGPFRVYTPFWNAVTSLHEVPRPLRKPGSIKTPSKVPQSLSLEKLELLPKINWTKGIAEAWSPGRQGAEKKLEDFAGGKVLNYGKSRNHPAEFGTSRLSPHLHFGEISPREVWHKIDGKTKTVAFLRQIIWREFAYHLLFHFPETPEKPLNKQFEKFPWKKNKRLFEVWQKGETGYPIVDAGMRELWQTGWMHNRVRMIVASFLVKDLMIPWQEGARWFWDTLVDADLANNTMGWQWVAGCGADAAPFFRIFNPVLQGEKFDPSGDYVRRWVPEISKLPEKWIHKPWLAPGDILTAAGVKIGQHYPAPVVDRESTRREALLAYERVKK